MRWSKAGWMWLCLLSVGCATATPQAEPSCFSCDDQRVVRIIPSAKLRSNDQGRRFQHPMNLTQAEWETLLRGVMVRSTHSPLLGPSYQGATEPLFLDEEVRALGSALRQAFQQATEQEAVVFATARATEEGPAQLTSGAWFVEAGRIHLRLANCRIAVTMASIRRQIWIDPLFMQAGTFYELVPGNHQALVSKPPGGGGLFRPDPVELVIDDSGRSEAVAPAAPEGMPRVPSASSLEERLAVLKRLHDQGLITEEEYRLKKQQLLDRL
ncbi:MAG TPA: SHOCT domain-containing protein [Nitrospira sp.]|nr:SHOCT domain-containing protein [Nitrospira sp.]